MVSLMRLELLKLKVGQYILSVAGITVILALWCNTNIPDEDTLSYSEAFSAISSYVRSTFIVFSSVLMARMIIDEYRNKTITVLFTYPINRKKRRSLEESRSMPSPAPV